jgi:chemotaxis protein methyltransferase CheR
MPAPPEASLPEDADAARFAEALRRLLGLQFEADRSEVLAALLRRRAGLHRVTIPAYLEMLAGASRSEIAALAEALTVTETSFFRNGEHMQAFAALVQAGRGDLRILSAGCASGEEPYSLAMIARAVRPEAPPAIRAFDINAAALGRAAAGRYSAWSLRQTPASFRARCFRPDGRFFLLDHDIRGGVDFSQRNLAEDDGAFWAPGSFDIVFCRNVLMYFAPEAARRAVARIARSLAPGGFLFLGHAETLRGLSEDFQLQHAHGTFYYQRGGGELSAAPVLPLPAREWAPGPAMADNVSWFDDILRASARVRALTAPPAAGGSRDD